jgi:carboxypeptidase Q
LGLGWSVGTPAEGLEAEVVVARDEAELDALGDRVAGRIVLFNNPMPPYDHVRGSRYGHTVRFRSKGAQMVAARGGVGVLVRSVTAHSLQTPHTGTQSYAKGQPPIPAAAVTVEGAELIARLVARGKTVKARLKMQAKLMDDVLSHNVIAELRGREKPDEIVVISAHIDSWDVGQGAHDDGGGVVMAMEVLRLLRTLDLRPRRTIRAVLFTNEENGLRGGKAYAKVHADELPRHVAAIEADAGAFAPTGYSLTHQDPAAERRALGRLRELVTLLAPLGADHAMQGFGGADIGPMRPFGVPLMGHRTNMEKYFDLHHTAADTIDKIDRREYARNVAALTVMAYVLAEMPHRLDAPTPPKTP